MPTRKINHHALRVIRTRSDIDTLRAFAARLEAEEGCKVNADHLSNIETGKRDPSPTLLRAMARVLRVPLVALLSYPDGDDDLEGEPARRRAA